MRVLFAVSEVDGLLKTGGLADVARHLPLSLSRLGIQCQIIIPFYRQVADKLPKSIRSYSVTSPLGDAVIHEFDFFGIPMFCCEIGDLFNRPQAYGENYQSYSDNPLRFAAYNLAVTNFLEQFGQQLEIMPDIMHCNDWHTSLIPYFVSRSSDQNVNGIKTVLTIHNGAFQGLFAHDDPACIQIAKYLPVSQQHPETYNFLELGINHADKVIAVSENYAKELLTPLGSHQLFDTFINNKNKLSGILNGCDYSLWDPNTDPYIEYQYSVPTLTVKQKNKEALQQWANLPVSNDHILFSISCRLTEQKVINYLIPAIEQAIQHEAQFIVAGTGDPILVEQLQNLQQRFPNKVYFFHHYDEAITHQIVAGSDVFMVPSLFEPCGLTQMHALAYGTLPLVRRVGGLADTVTDVAQPSGNGFVFDSPTSDSLLACLLRAMLIKLQTPEVFELAQKNALNTKFSWETCAKSYISEYKQLLLNR